MLSYLTLFLFVLPAILVVFSRSLKLSVYSLVFLASNIALLACGVGFVFLAVSIFIIILNLCLLFVLNFQITKNSMLAPMKVTPINTVYWVLFLTILLLLIENAGTGLRLLEDLYAVTIPVSTKYNINVYVDILHNYAFDIVVVTIAAFVVVTGTILAGHERYKEEGLRKSSKTSP